MCLIFIIFIGFSIKARPVGGGTSKCCCWGGRRNEQAVGELVGVAERTSWVANGRRKRATSIG
ncbi:MAG: hypothetical protein GY820_10320 [Gammaproteobacteria bacterium]|nr:hypothetical protein [Gammaproteobacteria bacterium]